jgi:hypothetical protein
VLRRQIALGSASESRLTKVFYAQSVFDELDRTITNHSKPEMFWMAARLLIESRQSAYVEKMSWSEELVRSYVEVILHAKKNRRAPEERMNTLVEMLRVRLKSSGVIGITCVSREAVRFEGRPPMWTHENRPNTIAIT